LHKNSLIFVCIGRFGRQPESLPGKISGADYPQGKMYCKTSNAGLTKNSQSAARLRQDSSYRIAVPNGCPSSMCYAQRDCFSGDLR